MVYIWKSDNMVSGVISCFIVGPFLAAMCVYYCATLCSLVLVESTLCVGGNISTNRHYLCVVKHGVSSF